MPFLDEVSNKFNTLPEPRPGGSRNPPLRFASGRYKQKPTRILFSNQLPFLRNQLDPARDSTHQNRSSTESSLAPRAKDNPLSGPGPVGGTMTSLEDVQLKSSVCPKLHGYREPDVAPLLLFAARKCATLAFPETCVERWMQCRLNRK